jgi:hypothetical protein
VRTLASALGVPPDSVTPARVRALAATTPEVRQARERYQYIVAAGAVAGRAAHGGGGAAGPRAYELNPRSTRAASSATASPGGRGGTPT